MSGPSAHGPPPAGDNSATALEAVDPLLPVRVSGEPEVVHAAAAFPNPGERLLYFELVDELGRGSFARVYLARQASLANRLVALKVTAAPTDEPQKLARLQHPNVVPIHSVHAVGSMQAICMPYLGRLTLARLLAHLGSTDGRRPDTGRVLLSTLLTDCQLAAARPEEPGDAAPRAGVPPALEALGHLSFVDAALWIAAQLAAGLAHAHAQGVYHRDLKPANVLLTDDGVPMILDFNTSVEARPGSPEWVGGTPQYMPQEQLRAFLGERCRVDARSDLYALGAILYELLTGAPPYPQLKKSTPLETARSLLPTRRRPPPRPSRLNPAVSPAVDAITLKLLDPDPDRRYASADELREDLQRQLTHRPLRYASDRSPRERLRKWRRRNPQLATGLAVAAAALALVVVPITVVAVSQARAAERAREVQRAEALVAYRAAADDLQAARVLLWAEADSPAQEDGERLAKNVLAGYAVADDPDWAARPAFARLDPDRQRELRSSLGEALIALTRVDLRRRALDDADRWNALARSVLPDADRPAVVERHRAEIEARRAGKPTPPLPPAEPRADADRYFDGRDLALAGRYREAVDRLGPFCDRHPDHFQAWYARGVCHANLRQLSEAATAFTVCVTLRPDFAWGYFNRGVVRVRQGKWADADADLTRALELKPGWSAALINRAIARQRLKQLKEAEADLTAALADPQAPTRVYFLRSRVRAAMRDKAGADADRAEGLAREPGDAVGRVTRGRWWADAKEPAKALADFDAALKLAPTNRDALLNKSIVLADHLGRPADALPTLDRLLELYPDDADGRAERGVCAARLGRADPARRDAEKVLAADQSPFRLYQMASLYAQLARTDAKARQEAIRLLSRAFAAGFDDFQLVRTDTDLDPIRDDPAVAELIRAAQTVRGKSR